MRPQRIHSKRINGQQDNPTKSAKRLCVLNMQGRFKHLKVFVLLAFNNFYQYLKVFKF